MDRHIRERHFHNNNNNNNNRAIARFVRRPEVVPSVKDDQDLDDSEADHNVWNDLFAHHTIAPLLVFALDDSTELSLALSSHFALDVFTVVQHGLPGVLKLCSLQLRLTQRMTR